VVNFLLVGIGGKRFPYLRNVVPKANKAGQPCPKVHNQSYHHPGGWMDRQGIASCL
jgi:hypothetical protein